MRGLTDEERELLLEPEDGTPCECCGIRGGGDRDPPPFNEAGLQTANRLATRGLLHASECDVAHHFRLSSLGRLALQLDAAARGMEVGR